MNALIENPKSVKINVDILRAASYNILAPLVQLTHVWRQDNNVSASSAFNPTSKNYDEFLAGMEAERANKLTFFVISRLNVIAAVENNPAAFMNEILLDLIKLIETDVCRTPEQRFNASMTLNIQFELTDAPVDLDQAWEQIDAFFSSVKSMIEVFSDHSVLDAEAERDQWAIYGVRDPEKIVEAVTAMNARYLLKFDGAADFAKNTVIEHMFATRIAHQPRYSH